MNIIGLITVKSSQKSTLEFGNGSSAEVQKGHYSYSSIQLRNIGKWAKLVTPKLPPQTVNKIRQLKLNKHRQRGKRGGSRFSLGLNPANLIDIKLNKDNSLQRQSKQIRMGLVNARSIKKKDLILHDKIEDHSLDFVIITETWLSETDDLWLASTDLNSSGLECYPFNRRSGRGGVWHWFQEAK